MSNNLAFLSLSSELCEDAYSCLIDWWNLLESDDRTQLAELTRLCDVPAEEKHLDDIGAEPEIETANELYDYLVNHEVKAFAPFFAAVSREGNQVKLAANVLAIPLCDPDWPPYSDSLYLEQWEPRGKLKGFDLGFVS